jgi:hypothetical protein
VLVFVWLSIVRPNYGARGIRLPFNFKPSRFTWIILIASSRTKSKNNDDRVSACFKTFLIGNISDKFLPTRTRLYVSFGHIFTNITSFTWIAISIRVLHKTSLLTDWLLTKVLLRSIKRCCTLHYIPVSFQVFVECGICDQ